MIEITYTTPRQLDALVAEYLFGWRWYAPKARLFASTFTLAEPGTFGSDYVEATPDELQKLDTSRVPEYTTWGGMGPVVKNREAAGYKWDMGGPIESVYWANLWAKDSIMFDSESEYPAFTGEHSTAPIAFAIAALASAGVDVTYAPEVVGHEL